MTFVTSESPSIRAGSTWHRGDAAGARTNPAAEIAPRKRSPLRGPGLKSAICRGIRSLVYLEVAPAKVSPGAGKPLASRQVQSPPKAARERGDGTNVAAHRPAAASTADLHKAHRAQDASRAARQKIGWARSPLQALERPASELSFDDLLRANDELSKPGVRRPSPPPARSPASYDDALEAIDSVLQSSGPRAGSPAPAEEGRTAVVAASPAGSEPSLDDALASLEREVGGSGSAGSPMEELDRVLGELSQTSAPPAPDAVAEPVRGPDLRAAGKAPSTATEILDQATPSRDAKTPSGPSSTSGGTSRAFEEFDQALRELDAAADAAARLP
jgi:hypothetical protein